MDLKYRIIVTICLVLFFVIVELTCEATGEAEPIMPSSSPNHNLPTSTSQPVPLSQYEDCFKTCWGSLVPENSQYSKAVTVPCSQCEFTGGLDWMACAACDASVSFGVGYAIGYAAICHQECSKSTSSTNQPSVSNQKNELGGINFTSIKLNYISVNENHSGGVDFDFLLKAHKADGASPGIDPINSTLISANAFMTGLAVSDDKFWVNLNPWEPDRIIDKQLGQSEVGRIMLEADLQMKRDFGNYTNPCANETGKTFWTLLDKKRDTLVQSCMEKFPGEIKNIFNVCFIPVTRHWIVPDKVYAYTNGTQIYIINATLKINSEPENHSYFRVVNQDNRSLSKGCLEELNKSSKEYNDYFRDLGNQMILPYVVADVNHGEKYEDLRDIYVSLALAQWYKSRITPQTDIFRDKFESSRPLVLKAMRPWSSKKIWDKLVYSFNNGEYRCWENTTTVHRPHSVGGVDFYGIKDHLINIEGMPSEIQDQVNRAVRNNYLNEKNDTLFGNRLHVDLMHDSKN